MFRNRVRKWKSESSGRGGVSPPWKETERGQESGVRCGGSTGSRPSASGMLPLHPTPLSNLHTTLLSLLHSQGSTPLFRFFRFCFTFPLTCRFASRKKNRERSIMTVPYLCLIHSSILLLSLLYHRLNNNETLWVSCSARSPHGT